MDHDESVKIFYKLQSPCAGKDIKDMVIFKKKLSGNE